MPKSTREIYNFRLPCCHVWLPESILTSSQNLNYLCKCLGIQFSLLSILFYGQTIMVLGCDWTTKLSEWDWICKSWRKASFSLLRFWLANPHWLVNITCFPVKCKPRGYTGLMWTLATKSHVVFGTQCCISPALSRPMARDDHNGIILCISMYNIYIYICLYIFLGVAI